MYVIKSTLIMNSFKQETFLMKHISYKQA